MKICDGGYEQLQDTLKKTPPFIEKMILDTIYKIDENQTLDQVCERLKLSNKLKQDICFHMVDYDMNALQAVQDMGFMPC